MDALRDGFVPGSFTQLRALAALAVGALLALLLGRLLTRRAPRAATGVGLVLLLVALVQPLVDAGDLLADRDAPPPLAVGLALVVGLALGSVLPQGERGRPVLALAVVLTSLPLLAPALDRGTLDFVDDVPPQYLFDLRTVLLGLLLGGAVAAVRPTRPAALLAVLGLVAVFAGHPLVDAPLVHAVAAGVALAVLLPHLLCGHEDTPDLRRGLLVGLVLVGLVTGLRGALTIAIDDVLYGPGGREAAVREQEEAERGQPG